MSSLASCSGDILYGHAGCPITSADLVLRLRATRLFIPVHSELLQMLVQRVDPELGEKGDGLVVDAILSIDTDRPSLKPLYRSALQVRNRFFLFCCGLVSGEKFLFLYNGCHVPPPTMLL